MKSVYRKLLAAIASAWRGFRALRHKLVSFELGLVLLALVVFCASTQHLRIEAKTGSVEIDISPASPIAWAMGGAELLDCSQLVQGAAVVSTTKNKQQRPLPDGAEIELAAIDEGGGKHLGTVRARVSLDGDGVVVELNALTKVKGDATATAQECSKDASRVAMLDTGDGKRRGIRLPAQFRLKGASIGNGLTLEFRGGLRIGNDVTSGRQPLLTSGRLTFREVRSHWLQGIADSQFDVESRDLSLGDKVTIAARSLDKVRDDAAQGFVRIVKEEKDKATEMLVYATTVAGLAEIVRPFSLPESPKANLFRRAWADELLSTIVAFIITLITLHIGYLQILVSRNGRKNC